MPGDMRKGVGQYRLTDDGGIEFESYHDIPYALKTWFNPMFERIHLGGTFTIKYEKNGDFLYKVEYTSPYDQPMMEMSGWDIINNFKSVYDPDEENEELEPTLVQFRAIKERVQKIYDNMSYSDLNEDIANEIRKMADEGLLPEYPKWREE